MKHWCTKLRMDLLPRSTTSFDGIPATDGRRIWMAWISNWLYANVEPTEIWRGWQSVPRELMLRRLPDGIRLLQRPIAELKALRISPAPTIITDAAAVPGSADIEIDLARGNWRDTTALGRSSRRARTG